MHHPPGMTGFEFAVMSGLRAAQLLRGCTPRVPTSTHKLIVTAQMEVAAGLIGRAPDAISEGTEKIRRV